MKAVVLVSGGLDSSTLLAEVLAQEPAALYALSFHYGQKHDRELAAAEWQCAQAGERLREWRRVSLAELGHLVGEASALTAGGPEVPELGAIPAGERTQPITYVPNRNLVMLSLAAAFAESRGADTVCYGAQAQDEYGYWDCTSDFVDRLNALLGLNRRGAVRVEAPFVALRKADVLRRGLELGVDFAHTWTCYRGGERACGVCPSCRERLAAFAELGLADPLPYAPPGQD